MKKFFIIGGLALLLGSAAATATQLISDGSGKCKFACSCTKFTQDKNKSGGVCTCGHMDFNHEKN